MSKINPKHIQDAEKNRIKELKKEQEKTKKLIKTNQNNGVDNLKRVLTESSYSDFKLKIKERIPKGFTETRELFTINVVIKGEIKDQFTAEGYYTIEGYQFFIEGAGLFVPDSTSIKELREAFKIIVKDYSHYLA